ncbi:hypothetical protein GCK72_005986 [Caenorhabditis remanei]|uniref:Uncharacterized protein n=1 Tax=Caenorhabditis remanei TaxID=31234 RepID=A0A6A5HG64_CAERE|nr:hypothetical protein GCK72_005986 [Caenorhabditis remanei]KAF1766031.1 hypothetical protein GCK72_005986 [Caenorhabditis remanei]
MYQHQHPTKDPGRQVKEWIRLVPALQHQDQLQAATRIEIWAFSHSAGNPYSNYRQGSKRAPSDPTPPQHAHSLAATFWNIPKSGAKTTAHERRALALQSFLKGHSTDGRLLSSSPQPPTRRPDNQHHVNDTNKYQHEHFAPYLRVAPPCRLRSEHSLAMGEKGKLSDKLNNQPSRSPTHSFTVKDL